MSQTPPDEPKLPRLPDFPPVTPPPAEPPSTEPDPSIEPVPSFPEPSLPAAEASNPADPPGGAGLPPRHDDDRGDLGDDPAGNGNDTGRGKRRGLVLGGVAVLAVLAVGGFLLFGGDGDESATPESTVRDFFEASKEQDCDRLVELVVEESWSRNGTVTREKAIEECNAELGSEADIEAELHEVEVTSEKGDKAIVQVNYSVADEKIDTQLDLVKEDGDWKIDAV